MKKLSLKSKILLGAFMIAGLGAGAQEVAFQIRNADEPVYLWDGSGPNHSGTFTGTIAAAQSQYGCSGTGAVCAEGVDTQGDLPDEVIRRNP